MPASLTPSRIVEAPSSGHAPALEPVETTAYDGAASTTAVGAVAGPRAGPGRTVSLAVVLFLAWGIGVLGLVTVQVARSARRRARLRAAMEPLPPEVERRIDELRAELGLRRAVHVLIVRDEAIDGPLVQGWVKPRILLPASLVRSWSRKALDAVLLHELVHLRRLDPAARALGNLLQIVYFFHPVVWWVHRRLAEEREKACDDAVVRLLGGDKRIYMKGLLRLVEERAGGGLGMHPELRMAAGRRPLARRLKRMLQRHYNPSPRVGALVMAGLALGVGLGCALSTGAPAQPPAQEAPLEEPQWRSLYEKGQAFAGDEVADVFFLVAQFLPPRGGFPLHATVLQKGEPPVLDVGDEEWILSFTLWLDARGSVESATLLRDSRANPLEETHESTPASERLAAYLKTFRFESIVPSDGTPERVGAMIDLRVSARGVEVATRGGEEWERRLAEAYRLPDGRNLDLRSPPHPPERTALYRAGHPVQARMVPWGPDMMTVVWTDGRPAFRGAQFTSAGTDLLSLMQSLGVRRSAVRFEGGARNVRITADVVRRDGASEEALVDDLPYVLGERLDLGLNFRVVSEPAATLVLRGSIGDVVPDSEQDGARVLHVFTDRRDEDPRSGAGGRVSDTAALADMLSRHLDMPVVDETNGPVAEPFRVRLHGGSQIPQDLDPLIENLEAQSGLDIAVEQRPNRVVVVSPS
ncbi:MAG: M56 family metallopeptidase [Acidobacteria bacterium]|nr:M56 family metallopeptidase [Acidobacteriota bacterium]